MSGTAGARVELRTVKAALTAAALRRLEPAAFRFCPNPGCDVGVLCYCFGENEADIRREIASHGGSRAPERIRSHIQAGRCACEVRSPRGACCLGDVIAIVKRLAATTGAASR